MRILFLAAACAAIIGAPVQAGMPMPQTMKCPIGGKKFTHITTMSYSMWGYRPDGKPYGSWYFPLEMPQCPDNGLVIFDEFTKVDLDQLKVLIASPDYRAMRDREMHYYLAAWLMAKMGRAPIDAAWMMVQASWQADSDPDQKRRYQQAYVEAIRALPQDKDNIDWLIMQGRAVNGLRELERFDEAKALLASLPLAALDVEVPAEKEIGTTASGLGKQISNADEIRQAERKRSFLNYFKEVGSLIDRGEAASEPLVFIPKREAAARCKSTNLSDSDKAFCDSPDMQAAIARFDR